MVKRQDRWLASSWALWMLVGLSCARIHVAPLPADVGATVAVLPPNNRTGDPLLVAGTSVYEKYIAGSPRVTVEDVLADEARLQLEQLGFSVLEPASVAEAIKGRWPDSPSQAAAIAHSANLEGAVLYIEIRRWEADRPTHPSYVVAGIEMSLIDPESGTILWSTRRRATPVATPGEVNLGAAYVTAARKVTKELLRGAE